MVSAWDVAVVGGGPAGLAAAIVGAERGLRVVVLEQRPFPPDKACGEGLLPPGVRALERLGVGPYLADAPRRRFAGIRFRQEDGTSIDAALPVGGGLGIRRTALVHALARRALALGATLWADTAVDAVERRRADARLATSHGEVAARLVVAADGMHSPIRRDAGLDAPPGARRRVALRRHYRVRPWTDHVEVHVDVLGEAVVTPAADDAVNVNVVWERGAIPTAPMDTMLARFPALRRRLDDATPISTVRGAGPMACRVRRRTADRLVLLGDAAGFVDSIAADGLSVAFDSALALGAHLPAVLACDATAASLRGYERAAARVFRRHQAVTGGLLWIARHPGVRRRLIHQLARHPDACRAMVAGAMQLMLAPA